MRALILLASLLALFIPSPAIAAQAPKAYIGLFGDNAVAVLDTSTNQVMTTIPVPNGPHGIAATPDGKTVYVSSDGDSVVSAIDTSTDRIKTTIEVGKAPHGLSMAPDGKHLYSAVYEGNQVVVIDTASNGITQRFDVPAPHNIAISPDGNTAYVASQQPGNFGLAVIDLKANKVGDMLPFDTAPRALNFTPDGSRLFFTLTNVSAVQALDPSTNQVVGEVPVSGSPHHPLISADGSTGLVVSQTPKPGELWVFNPGTDSPAGTIKVDMMPHWIALSPDGGTAYVTNEASNDLSVVDLGSQTVVATVQVGGAPRKIAVVTPNA